MNSSLDFFSEAAGVGSYILDTASPDVKRKYLEQVSRIYELLRDIHDVVIDITIKTSLAKDLDQAKHALEGINNEALEGTFRARNWCDRLERLGKAVHSLTDDAKLAGRNLEVWNEFCTAMEQREGEVALLYDDKLFQLRGLASTETSLVTLREKVDKISEELVTQKARFDYLAKKAEAERDRLG
jgi:chromosome segregation ATPase